VAAQVADTFLECGVLEHGFARIRCDACTHEYLLAFSCRCRYFCPSCHAKRLAIWTQWLETTLFAPVPHRQVVLTIPKRLRAYCLYRRRHAHRSRRTGRHAGRGRAEGGGRYSRLQCDLAQLRSGERRIGRVNFRRALNESRCFRLADSVGFGQFHSCFEVD
jgi:hypothetical protein